MAVKIFKTAKGRLEQRKEILLSRRRDMNLRKDIKRMEKEDKDEKFRRSKRGRAFKLIKQGGRFAFKELSKSGSSSSSAPRRRARRRAPATKFAVPKTRLSTSFKKKRKKTKRRGRSDHDVGYWI